MPSSRSSPETGRTVALPMAAVVVVTVAFGWGIAQWSDPQPLPTYSVSSVRKPAEINRCSDCHYEIHDDFQTAPHRITLTPAGDPAMQDRFADQEYRWPSGGPEFRFESRDGELWLRSDAYPDALRVDWIFGSGRHAQTPVSVWTNPAGQSELLQHRVSWYPAGEVGPTLGMSHDRDSASGIDLLGDVSRHSETLECFGCHVTHMPVLSGRIDEQRIVAGVRCERCHPGGKKHMAVIDDGVMTMERWSDLSPLESVNRCGECHRRADQLLPEELDPNRQVLVRFASVGLVMSRCFQQQSADGSVGELARLDCLTCHDPHRPAESDPAFYVSKCLDCHAVDDRPGAVCTAQPMTSQCLSCHMPRLKMEEDLHFTDHWIRIRTDTEAESEQEEDSRGSDD